MKKICEYCHTEYETDYKKQRFCCDNCRVRSYREQQRNERKKAMKVYRDHAPQPRRLYDNVISETDPRRQLARMKAGGLLNSEYWELFAMVDREYYGGRTIVNGIPTTEEAFADLVLMQIDIDRRIDIWTQSNKQGS